MKPVILTADSTCDLSPELKAQFQIRTVPLTITEGDASYLDGVDFQPDQIYEIYRKDGTLPKTSAVSPQEFLEFFGPLVEEGYEIVHVDISSKLSATYQNACIAAGELGGIYPVDSSHLSASSFLLLLEACRLRDAGKSAREIAQALEQQKQKLVTTFVVDTLEFIWKGGRCSGVTALGANLLHIKPCLEMRDGELKVGKKYRGSIEKVYAQYLRDLLSRDDIDTRAAVMVHSGGITEETLERLRQLVLELSPIERLYTLRAGCTISSHCGPGTMGLLFATK